MVTGWVRFSSRSAAWVAPPSVSVDEADRQPGTWVMMRWHDAHVLYMPDVSLTVLPNSNGFQSSLLDKPTAFSLGLLVPAILQPPRLWLNDGRPPNQHTPKTAH
jgi:hypothetical protein